MNKRLIITLTIVTLLVGLIYSTSNILNSYYSRTNDEFSFLPIGEWDDLLYYSFARELLDNPGMATYFEEIFKKQCTQEQPSSMSMSPGIGQEMKGLQEKPEQSEGIDNLSHMEVTQNM